MLPVYCEFHAFVMGNLNLLVLLGAQRVTTAPLATSTMVLKTTLKATLLTMLGMTLGSMLKMTPTKSRPRRRNQLRRRRWRLRSLRACAGCLPTSAATTNATGDSCKSRNTAVSLPVDAWRFREGTFVSVPLQASECIAFFSSFQRAVSSGTSSGDPRQVYIFFSQTYYFLCPNAPPSLCCSLVSHDLCLHDLARDDD